MSGNFGAFLPKNLQGSAPSSGAGPLYVQLRQSLEAAIRAGQLADGEALPPERDIAEYTNISRVTVRKAVDDLVKAGLLVRRHGSGTFVVRPGERVQQSLSILTSFTEDMARRGIATQSRWLERGLYYPSPEEMMKLGLSSETRVARLGRLRMVGDMPLAIERASLSSEFLPDPDAVQGSLYAELGRTGFRPVRAVQRIAACNIRRRMLAFLACRKAMRAFLSSVFPIWLRAAWWNLPSRSIAAMPMISLQS
ncbi:GntR family transcriptional regulator [Brucella melitensis]|nr:GntR family transcriptional regulator [Brucella melitensis]